MEDCNHVRGEEMNDRTLELQKVVLITSLFCEAEKVLDYIAKKEVRFIEKIDLDIEACIKFLERMKHIPNNDLIDRSIKEKIFDLSTLKTYNLKNGSYEDLKGKVITIIPKGGKPFKFTLHDYATNVNKYKQWIKNHSNKALTKNDVLTLMLWIVKVIGLDIGEYKEIIKKDYGVKIQAKKPRFTTILTPDALLMPPLDAINDNDGVFYDLSGDKNSFVNLGLFIVPMIEQSELTTDHHKHILNLIDNYKIIFTYTDRN